MEVLVVPILAILAGVGVFGLFLGMVALAVAGEYMSDDIEKF